MRIGCLLVNQLSRFAILALLVILLTACGTSSTEGGSGIRSGEIAGNSSGTVSGPAFGSGTADHADLRKIITVTLAEAHPTLGLGTAYLTRISDSSEYASLTLPVTNEGTSPLCFVWAQELTYRQGSTNVAINDLALAVGSVGRTESGNYVDSCLDTGETGYLIDITAPGDSLGLPLWSIDNLVIGSLSAGSGAVYAHDGKLVPTAYSTASGALESVTGLNQGTATIYPGQFTVYFLLDADGTPLEWSFLDAPASESLTAGMSANWTTTGYYEGSSSRIRVHFDYSLDPPDAAVAARPMSRHSRAEWLELRELQALELSGSIGASD